jgi:hypothetical protein
VQGIAGRLFTRYVFAFEVTSALLITAAAGAMILAHIERATGQKLGQPDRMRARFAPGSYPGAKAGPASTPPPTRWPRPAGCPTGGRPTQRAADPAQARADRGRGRAQGHGRKVDDRCSLGYYVVLAAILFTIGAVGVLIRRNAIVLFMCIELMLNASNLALVTFAGSTARWTARSWRSSSWWWPRPRSSSAWPSSCRSSGRALGQRRRREPAEVLRRTQHRA